MSAADAPATPAPVFLAGPTGIGKSAVAATIARATGAEVINADAYQVYRGMGILTAAPSPAEMADVPHHLFGVMPPTEACSAARFADAAAAKVHEVAARGNVPLVVGGSGLYLKALTHGLSPVPPGDEGLRGALARLPLAARARWLALLDPEAAACTDLHNPRYVDRALEICLLSGVPSSALRDQTPGDPKPVQSRFPGAVGFVLIPDDRAALRALIDRRTHTMLDAGVLAEIAALPPQLSDTAARAIGLRELRAHLAGTCTLDEAIAAVQLATRRYAKRQLTWFRREPFFQPQTVCLDPPASPTSTAQRLIGLVPHLEPR